MLIHTELAHVAHPIIDALPQRVCLLDESGRVLTLNAAWRAFAEEDGADHLSVAVGANYLDLCDEAVGDARPWAEKCAAGIRSVLGKGRQEFALEYPCHSADRHRWFLCTVRRVTGIDVVNVLVSHSDITERVLAQANYRDSERRFRSLAELSADAYWETDEEHRFTLTSWRADQPDHVEHSEWILAGILGKTRWEVPFLAATGEQWQKHKSDLAERRTFRNFEIKRVQGDSETRYFSVAGQPMFEAKGAFPRLSRSFSRHHRASGEHNQIPIQAPVLLQLQGLQGLIGALATRNAEKNASASQCHLFCEGESGKAPL